MSKTTIIDVKGREILDSKGNPTVEAEVHLKDGTKALGQVPSGASTGAKEALELRDGEEDRYNGKGVLQAVTNINGPIKETLVGQDASDQKKIDKLMIDADGTENKENFGANAIVGTSMAVCRAAARSMNIPLYKYFGQLSDNKEFRMPQPLILLLEGGKHGKWSTDCQEYFIIPKREKFENFKEMLRAGAETFKALEKILDAKGYAAGVGYEGAFMPKEISSNEEAFQLMLDATKKAGYKPEEEILLGIDAAASEFYQDGQYVLRSEGNIKLEPREWTQKVIEWTKNYPIWSLEDVHDEEDWEEWIYFTQEIGKDHQIVGDDLLVTNVKLIQEAIDKKAVNSVLIKLNQIGSVTETIKAIKLSEKANFTTVVSHRGGETNDSMIADLCVGTSSWQSKFGGPDRGDRVAKYNRLIRIEEELK